MKAKRMTLICILIAALALCGFASADTATGSGMTAPDFTVSQTTAARGELIPAFLGGVEGADYVRVETIKDDNNEAVWVSNHSWTGDIWLSTASLEPGTYTFRAFGVDESEERDPETDEPLEIVFGDAVEVSGITITPYTGAERSVITRIGRTQEALGDWTRLSVYAPGADYILLKIPGHPELDWGGTGEAWSYNVQLPAGDYAFTAEAYYTDGTVSTSNQVFLTVNPAEELAGLGEPRMSLNDRQIVPAGENFTVEYEFSEETGIEDLEVVHGWTLYDETNDHNIVYDTEDLSSSGSFVVEGDWLQAGYVYTVELYTYVRNENYAAKLLDRTVIAARPSSEDAELSLTSNGQSEVWVINHEDVPLTIHAPGARQVRLVRGYDWDWQPWDSEDENGFAEDIETFWWSHWKDSIWAFYLEATWDDPGAGDAEWFTSAPLILHVETNGQQLAAPEFTVSSPVQLGGLIEITLDELDENAEWCWADVYPFMDGDWDWIDWDTCLAHADMFNGRIYLPTNRLEPGCRYLVKAACSAPGWQDSLSSVRVFTTEGEAAEGPQFAIINPNVQTGENVAAVASVPGAYELRVYVNGETDDEWGRWGGDSMSCSDWVFWHSGDYQISLSARFTDEWESWNDWTTVETLTVHVSADAGELDLSGADIPLVGKAGEAWTLDLTDTDVAQLNFGLWKEGREDWGWGTDWTDEKTVTVPGEELDEGVFHWWLEVVAPGYEHDRIEGTLVVTGDEQDENIDLIVPEAALCGEDFEISAFAEGATAVSVWIPGWNDSLSGEDHLEYTEQIRWEGYVPVYARACYEEIDWDNLDWGNWQNEISWGPMSEIKIIHVTAPNGQAGLPEVVGLAPNQQIEWGHPIDVTVSGGANAAWYHVRIKPSDNDDEFWFAQIDEDEEGHGGSVSIPTVDLNPGDYRLNIYVAGRPGYAETGLDIPFTLTGFGQCGQSNPQIRQNSVVRGELLEVTFPPADNTETYVVRIHSTEEENWEEFFIGFYSEAGTVFLPTAGLEEGREYWVRVSTGAPGYDWYESDWETAPRFSVSEPDDSAIRFSIDRTSVDTCEDFTISVYAPGADEIRIMENGHELDHHRDNHYIGTHNRSTAGIYQFAALVHYPEEEENDYPELHGWVWSDTVTVTVGSEDTPFLDPEEIDFRMPSVIGADEDLVLSWQDAGLSHYDVNIRRLNNGPEIWHSWLHWDETGLTVPAVRPNDGNPHWIEYKVSPGERILEPGEGYELNISFQKRGYNELHIYHQFLVAPETDEGITLSVNGGLQDFTVPVNTNVEALIDAPAGAKIALAWGGYDWQWYDLNEDGDAELGWSWGDPSERNLFAKYTMEEPDDRPWEDYEWSGLSNIITVTVTSDGFAPAPVVTMDDEVLTGTEGQFTVTNAEEVGGFNWTVHDPIDDWEWNWEDWNESEEQIFGAHGLQIGRTYILKVHGYGLPGLQGSETEVPFIVTGQGTLPDMTVHVPESVIRGEILVVTIEDAADLAAEYEGLTFSAAPYFEPEDRWFDRWYDWDGTDTLRIPTADLEARDEDYTLFVDRWATGWTGDQMEFSFRVTEPEEHGIQFFIDKTEVETCEDFTISVYAPDALDIVIVEGLRPLDAVHEEDAFIRSHSCAEPGVYDYSVGVCFHGDEDWTYSDTITVTVGSENTPEMDAEALDLRFPTVLNPNENLEIRWNDIGLNHYDVDVRKADEGNHSVWHSWRRGRETSVTVPAVMPDRIPDCTDWTMAPGDPVLEPGRLYDVSVYFEQYAHRPLRINKQVLVNGETAQDITLTVNSSTTTVTVPVNTNVEALIDAPAGAKAALAWGGYDWQWYDLNEDGDAELGWSWGDLNERKLFAKYTMDEPDGRPWEDYEWSGLSNIITVTVTSDGFAPAPVVTMDDEVLTGTEGRFTVTNAEEIGGFNWTVHDPIDDWEWNWEDWNENEEQIFGAHGLQIGRTYILKVHGYGLPGLQGSETEVPFIVTGQGTLPDMTVRAPESVTRGEILVVTIEDAADLAAEYKGLTFSAAPYFEPEDRWFGRWYDWDGTDTIRIPTADLEARDEDYTLFVDRWATGWTGDQMEFSFRVTEPAQGDIQFYIDKTAVVPGEDFTLSVYAPGAEQIEILENGSRMDERGGDTYLASHWRGDCDTYEYRAMVRYPGSEEGVLSDPVTVTVGDENTPVIEEEDLGFTAPSELNEGETLQLSWNDIGLLHYDLNLYQNGRRVWHSWNRHGETYISVPALMPDWVNDQVEPLLGPGEEILTPGEVCEIDIRFEKFGYQALTIRRQVLILADTAEELILTVNAGTKDFTIPVNTNVQATVHAPQGATAVLAWGGYDWQWYGLDESGNAEFSWAWGDTGEHVLYAKYTMDEPDSRPWEDYHWSGLSNIIRVTPYANGTAPAPEAEIPGTIPVESETSFTVTNADAAGGFSWTIRDIYENRDEDWRDWEDRSTQTFSTRGYIIGRNYELILSGHGTPGLLGTETVIPFTAAGEGLIPMVQASVPETVVRGEMLEITIENLNELTAYDDLRISAEPWYEPDDIWSGHSENWTGGNVLRIPTADLEAGREYVLVITDGAPGWQENRAEYRFSVTETGAPVLTAGKTSLLTREMINVSFYAPGAEETRLLVDGWEWDREDGNTCIRTWWFGNSGTYTVSAEWRLGDTWTTLDSSQWISLTVSAPNGTYPMPEINFRPVLNSGEDLRVTVNPGEGSLPEAASIHVHNRDDNHEIWYEEIGPDSGWAFVIPGDRIDDPGSYSFQIELYGTGYEKLNLGHNFTVVGESSENIALYINDSMEDQTFLVNETFTVRAESAQATGIAVYTDGFWHFGRGSSLEFEDCQGLIYVSQWYAKYTTDILPDNENWWEDESISWSDPGNIIVVTTTGFGKIPVPEAELPDSVPYGQWIPVTITNLDEAFPIGQYEGLDLSAEAYDPETDWWAGRYSGHGEPGFIRVPTIWLEDGKTYEMHIRANAVGYEEEETVYTFTVTSSPAMQPVAFRTPAALQEIQEEAFAGIAAKTVEISGNVMSIGSRAFADSGVEEIYIPSSVEFIDDDAFDSGVAIYGEWDSNAMYWAIDHGFDFYPD